MAFIANFPKWQYTVDVYRVDGTSWNYAGGIRGQVYTPLRNQDDDRGGLMYFMMPKKQLIVAGDPLPWLLPREEFGGSADVIEIALPGENGLRAYRVREIKPRWLGHPNEHLLIEMVRLSTTEWSTTTHSVPPPTPVTPTPVTPPTVPPGVIPPDGLTIGGVDDDTCESCGDLNGTLDDWTYRGKIGDPVTGWNYWETEIFAWSCSPVGSVYWRLTAINGPTIGQDLTIMLELRYPWTGGEEPVLSQQIQTIPAWDGSNISFDDMSAMDGCDISAATFEVIFPDPGADGSFVTIHAAGFSDDACASCDEFNGDYTANWDEANLQFISEELTWGCITGGLRWSVHVWTDWWLLVLIVYTGGSPWRLLYRLPVGDWDGTGPATFEFWLEETGAQSMGCTAPPSIDVN